MEEMRNKLINQISKNIDDSRQIPIQLKQCLQDYDRDFAIEYMLEYIKSSQDASLKNKIYIELVRDKEFIPLICDRLLSGNVPNNLNVATTVPQPISSQNNDDNNLAYDSGDDHLQLDATTSQIVTTNGMNNDIDSSVQQQLMDGNNDNMNSNDNLNPTMLEMTAMDDDNDDQSIHNNNNNDNVSDTENESETEVNNNNYNSNSNINSTQNNNNNNNNNNSNNNNSSSQQDSSDVVCLWLYNFFKENDNHARLFAIQFIPCLIWCLLTRNSNRVSGIAAALLSLYKKECAS